MDILLKIYRSLIQPYLTYGLAVWGQAAQIHLNKLLVLQKGALRLINFASFQTHAIPFFEYHKILPLNSLYFKLISSIMYDVSNGLAPVNITKLFTPASLTHNYSTRFLAAGTSPLNFQELNI